MLKKTVEICLNSPLALIHETSHTKKESMLGAHPTQLPSVMRPGAPAYALLREKPSEPSSAERGYPCFDLFPASTYLNDGMIPSHVPRKNNVFKPPIHSNRIYKPEGLSHDNVIKTTRASMGSYRNQWILGYAKFRDTHLAGAIAKHLIRFLSKLPSFSRFLTANIVSNATTPAPNECPANVNV
nr:hypothetical protein Iba_scaffold18403CG0290 [Ipomoea batatas]